ncbi:6-phospho-3-hexuloisomerase [Sinomonas atrocyanea]|uniref:6-phospho-3-hexuloisomerase n=1 Tax=Sinomonas atrocyanea TaxID=37927 RepID=A0A127A3T3_9MICC|nr:6-phospho-3-hexuloisomerase [Sinomonas atrocyanea]GEB66544.1 3-hexulose-6-phosphate isomerase [Sinomonas atrocyanea]GGG58701.1 3-hexulose-6-phosphate isomerase [Sinomonas atrocyanea]
MSIETLPRQRRVTSDGVHRSLGLIHGEVIMATGELHRGELAAVAELISDAPRIFLAGAGRSGLVLRMAAMRLMHLGLDVHVAGDTTTPAIRSGDLLIAASGSGTTSGVVKAASTAAAVGARIAAFTTDGASPLAARAEAVVIIPAARKADHGGNASRQYSGSLFEQVLLVATEALFQTLWEVDGTPAEELWLRHANIE